MANRLLQETSPYLLQHAHNPVDWFAWGHEALQKAKVENKPILVSIGYSACHWCHVMERESFENEATANLMNSNFINIKIDREERPDLDSIYMDAVQLISGSGGWPLNVFLTPEAKPFYGGTYFPPVPAYNRSSWPEVLEAIAAAWASKPQEILAQADNLTEHLRNSSLFSQLQNTEAVIEKQQLETISDLMLKQGDTQWGGFGNAPKFPQTFTIQFLLRQQYFSRLQVTASSDTQTEKLEPGAQQALLSLDKMITGGIYDQLGGGFARYSTDAQWLAPHFEKMLYDNALLLSALSEAYQLTGNLLYKNTIEQTLAFVAAEWQDADGGFFSAYDADSEGVEGKYYVWQKAEVRQLIPEDEYFNLFCSYYDVTEGGNWEEVNILRVLSPLESFCKSTGKEENAVKIILEESRERLLQARSRRVKPLLDDKKLMGWNALMITACCKCYNALQHVDYLTMATKAAVFIEENLKSPNGTYHHNYKNGEARNPAFLDDLSYYIQALCHLQETTGNLAYLEMARKCTDFVIEYFADEESPFFYATPLGQNDVIIRKKEMYDGATPSGNSTMALNLCYLGHLLNEPSWVQQAAKMATAASGLVTKYPTSFALWAQLMQWQAYGLQEVAVVGPHSAHFSKQILGRYLPNMVFQQARGSHSSYPLLQGREPSDGSTLIYKCENYSCEAPKPSVEQFFATYYPHA